MFCLWRKVINSSDTVLRAQNSRLFNNLSFVSWIESQPISACWTKWNLHFLIFSSTLLLTKLPKKRFLSKKNIRLAQPRAPVSARKESYWRINNHMHNKLVENKKASNSFLFGLHSWDLLGCSTGVATLIVSRPRDQKKSGFRCLGSLSTRVFERRTATGRKHFACLDPLVTQIFILLISDKEKIPRNVNVVVWGQVKGENSSLPVAVRVSKSGNEFNH